MILHKIIYVLLWICAVLFFVMYRGELSLQLLIVCTLFPIPLYLLLLWQKLTLKVRLEAAAPEANCKERFYVLLHMRGKCPVPVHYAVATLNYVHSIAGENDMLDVHVPVMGSNAQVVRLPFSAPCCGKITIIGGDITIYDPISLFSMKVSCRDQVSVLVLPEMNRLEAMPPLPPAANAEQSERFSQVRAGDDPSEIFSVEPYQQGDTMSHVHWKLTAKTDAMMIKHFSLPIEDDMVLFVDYRRCGNDLESAVLLHHVVSLYASLSWMLLEQACSHRLLWYPIIEGERVAVSVESPDDVLAAVREMLSTFPYPHGEAAILGLEEPASSRMIYCTAVLDDETVLCLSALAAHCKLMVLYICQEEKPSLPEGINFDCFPVYCPPQAESEEVQNG